MGDRVVVSTLKIELSADGQVHVEGPLENRLLCYGLLGMAAEVVLERAIKGRGANLMVVPPMGGLKSMGNN
jgi:hypothetical protein